MLNPESAIEAAAYSIAGRPGAAVLRAGGGPQRLFGGGIDSSRFEGAVRPPQQARRVDLLQGERRVRPVAFRPRRLQGRQ
jgi:hypothetical protein